LLAVVHYKAYVFPAENIEFKTLLRVTENTVWRNIFGSYRVEGIRRWKKKVIY
jgi:hypothetical protein